MSGLLSLLNIARDGIFANQASLDVTSQNVAGASTPGYVRRSVNLENRPSGGVVASGIVRSFDRFSYSQLVEQSGLLSSATVRASALATTEALVSPQTDNLADRANSLIDAFHQLTLNPSDVAVRSTVLARASALANGFSQTADSLTAFRSELLHQATDVASEVNDRLKRIAQMDRTIVEAQARGESAAELRDGRDQLAREVGERVGARVVEGDDGTITLFSAGTVLYQGGRAAQLTINLDTNGNIAVQADRNGNVTDVTRNVTTGSLGGIVEVRDKDLTAALTSLDNFAFDVSKAFNDAHVTGVGLDGVGGRNLFSTTATATGAAHAMQLDPALGNDPQRLAAASVAGSLPGGNDVAVLLSRVGTTALAGGGTIAERYATMANGVGLARVTADGESAMREDTVSTVSSLRESASGVSTDEEMIRLDQFQRGFDASTRVLRVVDELFDTLLKSF